MASMEKRPVGWDRGLKGGGVGGREALTASWPSGRDQRDHLGQLSLTQTRMLEPKMLAG